MNHSNVFPTITPTTVAGWRSEIDRLLASEIREPLRSAALDMIAFQIRCTAWTGPARGAALAEAQRADDARDHDVDLLDGLDALVSGGHVTIGR